VVTEVVIVTSPNDGAGAKTAEAATIVDNGGARAKAIESAAAEASTGKATAAVEATAAKAATAKATAATASTATAAKAATAKTTAAMAATAASATTTMSQRHGRRSQANGCNSQRDYCLLQHIIFSTRDLAPITNPNVAIVGESFHRRGRLGRSTRRDRR
jgi:hypothetical protein